MAAVTPRRGLAWLRRNTLMNAPRNRLPFALVVVVLMGAGLALLAGQFLALGEVHAARTSSVARAIPQRGSDDPRLAKAYRFERGGWIYVHLEGSPHDIGYQHGYLLATEIADGFAAASLEMTHNSNRDWDFFGARREKCSGRRLIRNIRRSCREL